MNEPDARLAAPTPEQAAGGTHAVPRFEGSASRRHVKRPLRRLALEAAAERLRHPFAGPGPETVAQFVGYPRSGHSLIGALLDAHPQAIVAHELDAMGLFRKGWPVERILWMARANARAFSRHGRWWNGFRYEVEGATRPRRPRIVGDKKGDWAARWCAEDPGLVDRFAAAGSGRARWVLVTRHPLDNVATMSLRRGGTYDRLRIDRTDDFRAALAEAQADGRVAAEASDAMVEDYRALSAAVAGMKARVAPEDWHEVVYEDFVAAPKDGLAALATFLGLDPDPGWLDRAAKLVHASANRSRDRLRWRDDQRAALAATIATHDFLRRYADDA